MIAQPDQEMTCKSDANFAAAWLELRRRRIYAWGAIVLWLPTTILFSFLGQLLFGSTVLENPAGFLMFIVIVIAWYRRIHWPCPRCGRAFYSASWGFWPFTRHCLHCSLRKGSLEASDEA
jgi:hypothetical protein